MKGVKNLQCEIRVKFAGKLCYNIHKKLPWEGAACRWLPSKYLHFWKYYDMYRSSEYIKAINDKWKYPDAVEYCIDLKENENYTYKL